MKWEQVKSVLDRHFSGKRDPIFFGNSLTAEEQKSIRGKPKPYLLAGIDLLNAIDGTTIVEVGCMRRTMNHPIDAFDPDCCNDGHSTMFWGSTGKSVFSVDVNAASISHAQQAVKAYPNVTATCADGISYLKEFNRQIDLLFLDAWDGDTPNYAENHLLAYQAAADDMAKQSLILIDDTDVYYGGKGRLVIPAAIRNGYELLLIGRQTLLMRGME